MCQFTDNCIDRRRHAPFTSRRTESTALMDTRVHKNATMTPTLRRAIQASDKPMRVLAQAFGVSEDTIRTWRHREDTADRSHTAHHLNTTMTTAQEAVVATLRRMLWLPLEDLLVVTREFVNENASRSAVHRLLQRHGISRIPAEAKPQRPSKPFKAYDPGYLHVDVKYLPQMADEGKRRYLFVAIDRTTRWVYAEIFADKIAVAAHRFLHHLHKAFPVRIRTILAEHHFDSRVSLRQMLRHYVRLCSQYLPQKALEQFAPTGVMKSLHAERSELSHRTLRNRLMPDT